MRMRRSLTVVMGMTLFVIMSVRVIMPMMSMIMVVMTVP